MSNTYRIHGKNGFSIMEVLVAATLMAGVALGVMQIMKMQTKGQKKLAQDFEVQQAKVVLSKLFMDKNACLNTFQDLNPNGAGESPHQMEIRDKDNQIIWSVGKVFGEGTKGRMIYQSIRIGDYQSSTGEATITVEFKKSGKSDKAIKEASYGGTTIIQRIKVVVYLTSNKISSCYSDEDALINVLCTSLNGTLNSASQCTNLSLINDPTSPNHPYALISQGRTKIQENLEVTGKISSASLATTGNIISGGSLSAGNITSSGTLSANTVSTTGNITAAGTLTAGNVSTSGSVTAVAHYYSSDIAEKEDVRTIKAALANLNKLRGVSFKWKYNGKSDLGLIAQEVERVWPELVQADSYTGLKSVKYANLIAPLIEAIKEQHRTIKLLIHKNQELETRLDKVENQIKENCL